MLEEEKEDDVPPMLPEPVELDFDGEEGVTVDELVDGLELELELELVDAEGFTLNVPVPLEVFGGTVEPVTGLFWNVVGVYV